MSAPEPPADACGDVTTGIGGKPIGPCVKTGKHTVHANGRGCTWWMAQAEAVPDTGQAPDLAAFASEMVARISMAPSKPLLPWADLPQDLAFLAVVIDRLRAGAQIMAAELALQGVDQAAADDIRRRVAVLGTDTTLGGAS